MMQEMEETSSFLTESQPFNTELDNAKDLLWSGDIISYNKRIQIITVFALLIRIGLCVGLLTIIVLDNIQYIDIIQSILDLTNIVIVQLGVLLLIIFMDLLGFCLLKTRVYHFIFKWHSRLIFIYVITSVVLLQYNIIQYILISLVLWISVMILFIVLINGVELMKPREAVFGMYHNTRKNKNLPDHLDGVWFLFEKTRICQIIWINWTNAKVMKNNRLSTFVANKYGYGFEYNKKGIINLFVSWVLLMKTKFTFDDTYSKGQMTLYLCICCPIKRNITNLETINMDNNHYESTNNINGKLTEYKFTRIAKPNPVKEKELIIDEEIFKSVNYDLSLIITK